jgi:hypothetical protein
MLGTPLDPESAGEGITRFMWRRRKRKRLRLRLCFAIYQGHSTVRGDQGLGLRLQRFSSAKQFTTVGVVCLFFIN